MGILFTLLMNRICGVLTDRDVGVAVSRDGEDEDLAFHLVVPDDFDPWDCEVPFDVTAL